MTENSATENSATENSAAGIAPSTVPDDYPGRVTHFPETVSEIVLGIFGVQAPDAATASAVRGELCELTHGEHGATHRETAGHVDPHGVPTQLLVAYWTGESDYRAWWARADVQEYWAGAGQDETGVWREVMITGPERHQYASGQEDPAGPSEFLPLEPSDKFGFQGSYRARMRSAETDDFASSVPTLPEPAERDTRGRRLTVAVPENICFIREGQTWDLCSSEERAIWDAQMGPVIDDWVATLRDNPVRTGCISVRDCREQDLTGRQIDRRSQFAFLLSLRHIEEAARTDPAHLRLMKAFNDMYANLDFAPRMNIWVEVHIPRPGGIEAEYLNCHPRTGFLPYFPATPSPA